MKKNLALFLMMFAASICAQSGTVSIGSENLVYPVMPVFSFYGYSYSQQIVSKERFNQAGGTAGTITKIRYYCESTGSAITPWNNWAIYIGHTNKQDFQGDDWIPASQMTQVFSGEFSPVAGTWIEFEFSQPFVYNNLDNIVIAVDENAPGWTAASDPAQFYSYIDTGSKGMAVVSDSTNFDPENPLGGAILHAQVPMLQFDGQLLGVAAHSKNAVLVYPNPSDSIFNFASESEITMMEVFDLSGRKITSEKAQGSTSIDLRKLQAAQYLLRIHSIDGVFTNRIVKR
ncbi:T9SS type A sorting domain-containing protein [Flavobacterium sp.]|uniref:T9SS type A sorting domain-containing protein n=1 Tax=Flavobacterium sp. TaxID=239 RepID=UPI0012134AD8|nr:T9SS type A sorting domain-containing protein [Flavobacterium sp.]RZJ73347.1 MAG: T9SS type A sorting domain-containing protein [Flavobacterium sp.]